MTNKISKKQHYIPRFIIRNFIVGKEEIKIFDKYNNIIYTRKNTNNIFSVNNIYNYNSDDVLEKIFSQKESDASKIIRKIINLQKHVCNTLGNKKQKSKDIELSNKEKILIKEFILLMIMRNPYFIKEITHKKGSRIAWNTIRKTPWIRNISSIYYFNKAFSNVYRQIYKENFYAKAMADAITADRYESIKKIKKHELIIITKFKSDIEFIITDRPWFYHSVNNLYGGIFMSIHPLVAIGINTLIRSDGHDKIYIISDMEVKRINKQLFNNSTIIIPAKNRLVDSYIKNTKKNNKRKKNFHIK